MHVAIRRAGPADRPALASLAALLDTKTRKATAEARLAALPESGHALFLAEAEGGIVGWLHVFLTWRLTSDRFAEIGGLAVAPEQRRRGVGHALLAAAEDWARAGGALALRVRVGSKRREAPGLYAAAGFRPLKRQEVYVKDLPG